MNNLKYLRGIDDNGFMARGGKKLVERTFGFLFILVLASLPVGCLVGNEEYDQALRERDDYNAQLQTLRLANDQLNRDISTIYADCDILNSQLSILAALSIHDKYTDGLKRPEPAVAATPGRRPGPTAAPGNTRRPVVTGDRPAQPRRNTDGAQGSAGAQRPRSGQQSTTNQPARTPQGGQATTPTPPPAAPPSGPSGGGGGAIDWGF